MGSSLSRDSFSFPFLWCFQNYFVTLPSHITKNCMFMKKQILLFVLAFLPMMASAFTGEVVFNGVKYFVKTAAQVAEVRGYTSECPSNLVIPATVECEDVTCNVILITNGAFQYCSSLTSITIPNSVTRE